MRDMKKLTKQVRTFVLDDLIEERRSKRDEFPDDDKNLLDILLDQVAEDEVNGKVRYRIWFTVSIF